MKAIILAGGEGRRLRPLTDTVPKPLLEIAGMPVLTYLLRLLSKNGISEAVIAAGYCSERLIKYYGKEAEGVRLSWHVEEAPRGTAGCVRDIAEGTEEDLLVISGDAMCEFDLAGAVRYHHIKKAKATLVLSRADDPGEFGVVCCENGGEGRITGFIEKPHISQCVSDMVNSGVYVLNPSVLKRVPADTPYDFGHELFPALLRDNEEIYGLYDGGFWCDIGDVNRFVEVNRRYNSSYGKKSAAGAFSGSREIIVNPEVPAVIGEDCVIAGSALAEGAVIGSGCRIGENSDIRNAVLGEYVTVGKGCAIGPGAVIGGTCSIGDYCRIGSGVHLSAGSVLENGESISSDTACIAVNHLEFTEYGFRVPDNPSSYPSLHAVGGVISSFSDGSPVCVLRGGGSASEAADTLIKGIISAGGNCFSGGEAFESMASYTAFRLGLELLLFVECCGGYVYVNLYDKNGLYIGRDKERQLRMLLSECRKRCVNRGSLTELYGIRSMYVAHILQECKSIISDKTNGGWGVVVKPSSYSENDNGCVTVLREAVSYLGLDVRDTATGDKPYLVLEITPDGRYSGAYVISSDGRVLSSANHFDISALICENMTAGNGNEILLPVTAPQYLAQILESKGYVIGYYTECSPCGYSGDKNAFEKRLGIYEDGCRAAMRLIGIIIESGLSPEKLLDSFVRREFARLEVMLNSGAKPSLMRKAGRWSEEGITTVSGGYEVRIIPRTYGYTVICEGEGAEAEAAETAERLRNMHFSETAGKEDIPISQSGASTVSLQKTDAGL